MIDTRMLKRLRTLHGLSLIFIVLSSSISYSLIWLLFNRPELTNSGTYGFFALAALPLIALSVHSVYNSWKPGQFAYNYLTGILYIIPVVSSLTVFLSMAAFETPVNPAYNLICLGFWLYYCLPHLVALAYSPVAPKLKSLGLTASLCATVGLIAIQILAIQSPNAIPLGVASLMTAFAAIFCAGTFHDQSAVQTARVTAIAWAIWITLAVMTYSIYDPRLSQVLAVSGIGLSLLLLYSSLAYVHTHPANQPTLDLTVTLAAAIVHLTTALFTFLWVDINPANQWLYLAIVGPNTVLALYWLYLATRNYSPDSRVGTIRACLIWGAVFYLVAAVAARFNPEIVRVASAIASATLFGMSGVYTLELLLEHRSPSNNNQSA